LQVATGQIQDDITVAKKRVDFWAPLDDTIAEEAKKREINIIFG